MRRLGFLALVARVVAAATTNATPRRGGATPRYVIVGETGAGKSTLGNALLGRREFVVGDDFDAVTTETRCAANARFELCDTPGFNDAGRADDALAAAILGSCANASAGIIYVHNARSPRLSRAARKALRLVFDGLGDDGASNRADDRSGADETTRKGGGATTRKDGGATSRKDGGATRRSDHGATSRKDGSPSRPPSLSLDRVFFVLTRSAGVLDGKLWRDQLAPTLCEKLGACVGAPTVAFAGWNTPLLDAPAMAGSRLRRALAGWRRRVEGLTPLRTRAPAPPDACKVEARRHEAACRRRNE